jgi:hypothetical protein
MQQSAHHETHDWNKNAVSEPGLPSMRRCVFNKCNCTMRVHFVIGGSFASREACAHASLRISVYGGKGAAFDASLRV